LINILGSRLTILKEAREEIEDIAKEARKVIKEAREVIS
jgi:hypothetical protein